MAKFDNKASMFLKLAIMLSLFLMIATAQGGKIDIGFGDVKSTPQCDSIYGAQAGDTCTTVADEFNLTLEFFLSINPNINCDNFFVGQWLCTDGTA